MDRAVGDAWFTHDRESWVWLDGRFVPYPLQNNLFALSEQARAACIEGLRRRGSGPAPGNFAEWSRATFGDGLHDLFMQIGRAHV